MANKENPDINKIKEGTPTIQTLNIVPQKVIQVDKPIGYYGNREKTKIFIYQVYLYWIVNAAGFPNKKT